METKITFLLQVHFGSICFPKVERTFNCFKIARARQARQASTVVTDTIWKIDYETARYSKLLGTLASSIDATGLQGAETDMAAVLLRSLSEVVSTVLSVVVA